MRKRKLAYRKLKVFSGAFPKIVQVFDENKL